MYNSGRDSFKATVNGVEFFKENDPISNSWERFKSESYKHILNDTIPLETRVYIAEVHFFMHYERSRYGYTFDKKLWIIDFPTYVASRLYGVIVDNDIPPQLDVEVSVALANKFGIIEGLIEPGYSYFKMKDNKEIDFDIRNNTCRKYTTEETNDVIEKFISCNKK